MSRSDLTTRERIALIHIRYTSQAVQELYKLRRHVPATDITTVNAEIGRVEDLLPRGPM
jgi:hypothetical protein